MVGGAGGFSAFFPRLAFSGQGTWGGEGGRGGLGGTAARGTGIPSIQLSVAGKEQKQLTGEPEELVSGRCPQGAVTRFHHLPCTCLLGAGPLLLHLVLLLGSCPCPAFSFGLFCSISSLSSSVLAREVGLSKTEYYFEVPWDLLLKGYPLKSWQVESHWKTTKTLSRFKI